MSGVSIGATSSASNAYRLLQGQVQSRDNGRGSEDVYVAGTTADDCAKPDASLMRILTRSDSDGTSVVLRNHGAVDNMRVAFTRDAEGQLGLEVRNPGRTSALDVGAWRRPVAKSTVHIPIAGPSGLNVDLLNRMIESRRGVYEVSITHTDAAAKINIGAHHGGPFSTWELLNIPKTGDVRHVTDMVGDGPVKADIRGAGRDNPEECVETLVASARRGDVEGVQRSFNPEGHMRHFAHDKTSAAALIEHLRTHDFKMTGVEALGDTRSMHSVAGSGQVEFSHTANGWQIDRGTPFYF